MTTRSTIFLSHAAPEDDDFTRWLAGKLALAGYIIWHDLEWLKGGDYFWNKIEHVIRNESIRLIAIVSNASYKKNGVRNEWDLGMTIEEQIPGFVIPVRIDSFDFRQLPINLHRKNVIDFYQGWHGGLVRLIDTLENANVQKRSDADPANAKAWLPSLPKGAIGWIEHPETLESNWLSIISLPTVMETTRILNSQRQIRVTDDIGHLPWFEYGDQIVGFAPYTELVNMFKHTVPLELVSEIDTEAFLSGGVTWGAGRVSPWDARNRVRFLILQAWDLAMEKLGLKSFELSNHCLIWYVPFGLVLKNKVEFVEWDGKRRKKQLAGTSATRKVNWHYAVSMHPILDEPRSIQLQAHVVFTDTDDQPIQSVARMHQLRRSFCKNWWNDRWRGFLRAFLVLVAQGKDVINLPVGGGRSVQISASPITFLAPRGLTDLSKLTDDEEIQLDEVDGNDNLFEDEVLIQDEEDIE